MLSLNNVRQLREFLHDTLVLCDDMLRRRETENLFDTTKDYESSQISKRVCPNDYYDFRLFDKRLTLFYHLQRKNYYIRCDMPQFFTKFTTTQLFYEIQSRLNLHISGISINIPKDTSFEDVEYIFTQLCILLIHQVYKDYGLQSPVSDTERQSSPYIF